MFDLAKFPFSNILDKTNIPLKHWIYYKELKIVNEDEFTPDFYTYILISIIGDVIYISTNEYTENDDSYFIKSRIKTDDVQLTNLDFAYINFIGITKNKLLTLVDNMITQKIRNLLIN